MVQGCRCRLAASGILRSCQACIGVRLFSVGPFLLTHCVHVLQHVCTAPLIPGQHNQILTRTSVRRSPNWPAVHKLSHHALFLYRKFDGLRETIRPASQDDSFDGIRGESCFELLQQDLVGCSTHPAKRLQEQPAQVTSVHTDVLAEKIQRRNAPGRCASRRVRKGPTSGRHNHPFPGCAWPSLRPAPPHRCDTVIGLLFAHALNGRLRYRTIYTRRTV
ncbi:hypothetical protein T03_4419 [Trichinella britovi]|uniref:Uncharacterized protein n=1 Tax=Trichinella britovi TaxID=45882 RepID=A0A0V1CCW5_TRIBR|nr:hypothetical protein T03_4419 [Trichinella britovi]